MLTIFVKPTLNHVKTNKANLMFWVFRLTFAQNF